MNKEEFQQLVDKYLQNLNSFSTNSVKVAGTRARKFAQEITKELKSSRATILSKQKTF